MIRFTVYGECQPAGSKRAFMRPGMKFPVVVDDNPNSKGWKRQIAAAAGALMQGRALLDGPLSITVTFYRPRPKGHFGSGRNAGSLRASAPTHPVTKPDLLKLARAVEDALTGIVYRDDSQICEETLRKEFGEPARVEIAVGELGERAPRCGACEEDLFAPEPVQASAGGVPGSPRGSGPRGELRSRSSNSGKAGGYENINDVRADG